MSYQLVNARVWDGSQWVAAVDPSPPPQAAWYQSVPVVYGDTGSAFVTAGALNTKGNWTQVIASTTQAASAMFWQWNTNTTFRAFLADVGIGASGSETVIAANIPIGYGTSTAPGLPYSGRDTIIPLNIPSGSRISVRVQSEVASASIQTLVWMAKNGLSASHVDTLGANTANSGGVVVSTNNAWIEIVASTSHAYTAFSPIPAPRGNNLPAIIPLLEVGYGAAGAEVSLGGVPYRVTTSEVAVRYSPSPAWIPGNVPAGSRIAVRAQATSSVVDYVLLAAR